MNARVPNVSVLLPTYRQPEALVLTLRDLQQQDYPPEAWELVILDDGSHDASSQMALALLSDHIALTVRRGPAGGVYSHAGLFNKLLRLADPGSDVFVHVEDSRFKPDFLRQHAKWHGSPQEVIVTGPMCEGPVETFDPEACLRWQLMVTPGIRANAYRCCFQAVFAKTMSYTRTLRNTLTDPTRRGPFDEAMSGWGYHETEFALRAQRAGATCIYDVRCGVYHPPHNPRDELHYRKIDRGQARSDGTARNIEYLCRKHRMPRLPDWQVGIPVEAPPEPLRSRSIARKDQ